MKVKVAKTEAEQKSDQPIWMYIDAGYWPDVRDPCYEPHIDMNVFLSLDEAIALRDQLSKLIEVTHESQN